MATGHTIVVGGGIVGVSTAYYLARRGHRVTLVERGELGAGASGGNAGIVAIGHPPMPRPGLVRQVLKWMLNGGSPLYVPPRFDPALFRWLWDFRRACTEDKFRRSMNVLAALGRETRACFEQIMSDESMTCEFHRGGWREVFRTEAGLAEGRVAAEILQEHDFDIEILDGDELRRREPVFRDDVVGAVQYTDSSFTDPLQFLLELAEKARGHGAVLHTNARIVDTLVSGGRFRAVRLHSGEQFQGDTLVLAAGIWTTQLARQLGISVPMQAGKGYHRNVTRPSPCLGVASVLSEKHVAVTPMGDVLRLSGTVEFSGINDRLNRRRLDMLSAAARTYLKGVGQCRTVSEWCGLRPCTADGLPVVGWAPGLTGVFLATGHARMGFTLGPVTGRLASECILDGKPSVDITALRADRFGTRRRNLDTARRRGNTDMTSRV
ncbi:MAG: FAD-dependent oxidoreductase [Planctomycetes bacterium]|nr:FAD-dependent oxidoreductase [Planctomycetota bacterium]